MNAPVTLPLPVAGASTRGLQQLVEHAARAIAPLWPLATFAARSPWQYLEEQSFDSVARHQQTRHGIPLYPSLAVSRRALAGGEIALPDLNERLLAHLDQQGAGLARLPALLFLEHAVRGEARELRPAEAQAWHILATTLALPAPTPAGNAGPSRHPLLQATVIRYAKLHVGAAEAAWPLPEASAGLYAAWRALVEHDPLLPRSVRRALATCPADRDSVLTQALHGLDEGSALALLEDHLLALPGWAGLLRWQGRQVGDEIAPLLDLLALRLALAPTLPATLPAAAPVAPLDTLLALAAHSDFTPARFAALSPAEQAGWLALAAGFDDTARERVLLEAIELGFRRKLEESLAQAQPATAVPPEVQLVFCIDVRSEPLRRVLEAAGPFATFGFAGFFGMPVRTRQAAARHAHAACPVILAPMAEIREIVPLPSAAARLEASVAATTAREDTSRRLKQDPLASLAMPELSGLWHGLQMAWHSLLPAAWRRGLAPARKRSLPATVIDLAHIGRHDALPVGLTLDKQVEWTAAALRGIGLVRDLAPLVVVVGHGSRSRNNPYAAKLDCGACGGASGAFNARLLVTLANTPLVRARLCAHGIMIPPATRFVAAEHVTSLDTLEWLDPAPTDAAAGAAWQRLQAALPAITAAVRHQRLQQLPAAGGHATARGSATADALEAWRRASDWSETRPEWGLARNAAFIIGRRALTAGVDLEGRAFLHSYDWCDDPDGALLAGIVAGPVTVGQWINLQYYASTVAPAHHGSGSKTTQTVTAGVGVMQGNASDLLPGLPWQAVMTDDDTPWHHPQRLQVLIEAPAAHVQRLLTGSPDFAQKLRNGWLRLASIDPDTGAWRDWK